jgi:hypothetical protein
VHVLCTCNACVVCCCYCKFNVVLLVASCWCKLCAFCVVHPSVLSGAYLLLLGWQSCWNCSTSEHTCMQFKNNVSCTKLLEAMLVLLMLVGVGCKLWVWMWKVGVVVGGTSEVVASCDEF